MPIYEFSCGQCGVIFEELVRMGSTGEGVTCPKCGHAHVTKRMSTCNSKVATSGAACPMADMGCTPQMTGGCCGGACAGH